MKRTTFPCPACRGKGSEFDRITDDGEGVWYECGLCGDGEGQLVIGGEEHRAYVLDTKLADLLWRWPTRDYDEVEADEINRRIEAIKQVIESFWEFMAVREMGKK